MSNAPDNAVVWTEIPVSDINASITFYNTVFKRNMEIDTSGPNPMAIFTDMNSGVSGHLYPGTPSSKGAGPTIHFAVPDTLEATMERCTEAGGEVMDTIIPLPMGRFAYAYDPDGNSIGLYQPN